MSVNKTVEDSSIDFEFNFYKSLYKKLPNDKRLLSILAEMYTRNGEIDKGLRIRQKVSRNRCIQLNGTL